MYKDKVVKIRLEGNQIVLIDGDEERVVDWMDVQELSKLLFINGGNICLKLKKLLPR